MRSEDLCLVYRLISIVNLYLVSPEGKKSAAINRKFISFSKRPIESIWIVLLYQSCNNQSKKLPCITHFLSYLGIFAICGSSAGKSLLISIDSHIRMLTWVWSIIANWFCNRNKLVCIQMDLPTWFHWVNINYLNNTFPCWKLLTLLPTSVTRV